ncbi:hypothetical protein ACJIZ3_021393 [Penstemon smallii]|uniref:Protein EARLY FLOWERING 4 domain-containing protein n=1 Tax=Penstemon smallii TaxID=265156 RepID=A0ABD3SLA3_9LAMI
MFHLDFQIIWSKFEISPKEFNSTNILDQNRLLIHQINQNQESKIPDNLSKNVGLIRDLNNNIRRVVDLYADLSTSFTKSIDGSSGGDSKSDGKAGQKRLRPESVQDLYVEN